MRESDRERKREDRLRLHHRREQAYLRSLSPIERSHWGGRGPGWVPPKGGDGDDWLDVRPKRRKARRQWNRGQDWQLEDKRFRNWEDAGKRQSRVRDSRDGFFDSDNDYYQDREADWYYEESEEDWFRHEDRRRKGNLQRREEGPNPGMKEKNRRADGSILPTVREQNSKHNDTVTGNSSCRFVTFYFTNFPSYLSNFYLCKGLEICGMLEEVMVL